MTAEIGGVTQRRMMTGARLKSRQAAIPASIQRLVRLDRFFRILNSASTRAHNLTPYAALSLFPGGIIHKHA
jgi:hypothetical protein